MRGRGGPPFLGSNFARAAAAAAVHMPPYTSHRTTKARLSAVCCRRFLLVRMYTDRKAESESYLVDPASSHMLVSKIKPCMSKYKQLYRETADGSLKQLSVYLMVPLLLG